MRVTRRVTWQSIVQALLDWAGWACYPTLPGGFGIHTTSMMQIVPTPELDIHRRFHLHEYHRTGMSLIAGQK